MKTIHNFLHQSAAAATGAALTLATLAAVVHQVPAQCRQTTAPVSAPITQSEVRAFAPSDDTLVRQMRSYVRELAK